MVRAWLAVLIITCPTVTAQEALRCNQTHCMVPIEVLKLLAADAAKANEYARLCNWGKP